MTPALLALALLAAPADAPGLCGESGERRCTAADRALSREVGRAFDALFALCAPADAIEMEPHVREQAHQYRVPVAILVAVAKAETGCRKGRVSSRGAVGRWQILPTGSAALPLRGLSVEALASDEVNSYLAARHLRKLYRLCGNWPSAISIYHGGNRRCSQRPTAYSNEVMQWARQATSGRRS